MQLLESSHNEFVAARPRETSVEAVTLAAGWGENNLQTGFVYALHSYWTSTKIPFRLCFHSFCSQLQIPTNVHCQEQDLVNVAFFYSNSGPAAWNTLPSDLRDITDTSTFRKRLKNVLFDRAFNWFCWRSCTCRIAAPYKRWLIDWLIEQFQVQAS